jgi:hypothetical protein
MKLKLPVHLSPGFETECYHNLRLSIIYAYPNLRQWSLSYFVNLKVQSSIHDQFPMVRFEEHLDIYNHILEETPFNSYGSTVDEVCRAIEARKYVLMFLNWSNIKSSNHYGSSTDMIHECLIYGYSHETSEFDILAFDVNGLSYGKAKISYEECKREFSRVCNENVRSHQWFAYYGFPAACIHVNDSVIVEMDYRRIFFALDRGRVSSSIKKDEIEWFALGYFVPEALSHYFLQISKGRPLPADEYSLWNVTNYKMILQNKLMLEKIDCLLFGCGESEIKRLNRIKQFYLKRGNLLLLAIGYSKKFQKDNDPQFLFSLSETYNNIFECEKRATPILMEYLVHDKLNSQDDPQ